MNMGRVSAGVCLVAVVATLPACNVAVDVQGYTEREEKRFPAEKTVELHLYTFDGAVEVRSWSRPEVAIEVEKRGQDKEAVGRIQVRADRTGDRIQLEARHPDRSGVFIGIGQSPSARLVASVPRYTNLVVRSGDGSILVERVDGRIELRTDDGTIRAVSVSGDLLAESGDGGITLEDVRGRIDARTDDGALRLTGTPSVLRARSGDGSVVLRLRPETAMTADWSVVTDDGSIEVDLPAGFNAELEADPGSDGRARSDLTLVNSSGGTREHRILRGRLGTGGHRLMLKTGDGTIRLRER
jgi:hypothetical protein